MRDDTLRVERTARGEFVLEHYGTVGSFLAFIERNDPCVLRQARENASGDAGWRTVGYWRDGSQAVEWALAAS